jgi:hypothetical protein
MSRTKQQNILNNTSTHGATLLGLTIYLALATIVLGSLSMLVGSLLESIRIGDRLQGVTMTREFMRDRIEFALRDHMEVIIPNPGDVSDRLVLGKSDTSGSTISIYIDGSRLRYVDSDGMDDFISPHSMAIETIRFYHTTNYSTGAILTTQIESETNDLFQYTYSIGL